MFIRVQYGFIFLPSNVSESLLVKCAGVEPADTNGQQGILYSFI